MLLINYLLVICLLHFKLQLHIKSNTIVKNKNDTQLSDRQKLRFRISICVPVDTYINKIKEKIQSSNNKFNKMPKSLTYNEVTSIFNILTPLTEDLKF